MNKLKPCPFCGYPAVFEPFKERKGYAATIRCCNCPAEITTITYDTEKEAEMEAVFAWNTRNTDNVVETGEITSVITRLRSNRDSNLTRYTSNEGKESHVIVSQKDRGYFQALDDIEEALLKKEKTDEAEKHN